MPKPRKKVIIEWEDVEYASIWQMAKKYNVAYTTAANWVNGKHRPRFMKNVKIIEQR